MLIYDPERDAYVILGVDTKATPDEIEAAYRKAALTWHPDKTSASDATERFQEARTAADILRDKTKRSEYDHLRRMHLGVRAEGRRQTRPAAAPQPYAPLAPAPLWMGERVRVNFDAVVVNLKLPPPAGRQGRWADAIGFLALVASITTRDVKFAALALIFLFIARVLSTPPHQGLLAWAKLIPGRRLAEYHMLDRRTSRYENWAVPFQHLGIAIIPTGNQWHIQIVGFPHAVAPELGRTRSIDEARRLAREAAQWLHLPLRNAA